jgi:3-dehydroquinate synthase II
MRIALILHTTFQVSLTFYAVLQSVHGYDSCYRFFSRFSLSRSSAIMSRSEAWLDYTNKPVEKEISATYPIDRILFGDSFESLLKRFDVHSVHQRPQQLLVNNLLITEKESDRVVGAIVEISSVHGQNNAISLLGSVEWIAVRCIGDWTMIPVENLIAACDNTGTKLAVFVDSVENLPGVLFALELGPHAVVLSPDTRLWDAYVALRRNSSAKEASGDIATSIDNPEILREATITGIRTGGIGDRVCLDLIEMLKEGEGLFIGSCAKLLALVHGETFEGDYVPSRPFRVNAGPVHSYVLMADGSTKYLCEIKAGDSVKVIDAGALDNDGVKPSLKGRAVTVGRCKIESRPMLIISYQNGVNVNSDIGDSVPISSACTGQIFLQQAETVRLICPVLDETNSKVDCHDRPFKAVSVTNIAVGDVIFVLKNESGTHVGNRVSSKVVEL